MYLTSFLYLDYRGYLILYKIFEIDEGVYYVHSANQKDYYGKLIEHEFWVRKIGVWVSEPAVDQKLLKQVGAAVEKYRNNPPPQL